MKPVVQEELTGCGIASVAAIAGVDYRQARAAAARLGIVAADPRLWSDTGHVRVLLRHFGISAANGESPFTAWNALPDLALLAIKWHLAKGHPCWHWVVFVRTLSGAVVLDPKRALRSNVRRDFGRIKPKFFIAIPGRQ